MKPTEHNAFLNEALETLNRIYKDNKHLTQLRWFLEVALQRFNKDYLNSRSPRLIVLGDEQGIALVPVEAFETGLRKAMGYASKDANVTEPWTR